MNSFTTIFFVIPPHYDPPDPLSWALIGSVPLIMGVILLLVWLNKSRSIAKLGSGERNYHDLFVTGILIVVGVCFTLNFGGAYFVQRNEASQFAHLYATQQYQVVEGTVHVLRLQPKGGHAPGDLIEIGNKQFEIDYYSDTVGYDQTIANGGVLTEGTYARVYFVDDTIIRVEIRIPAQSLNP